MLITVCRGWTLRVGAPFAEENAIDVVETEIECRAAGDVCVNGDGEVAGRRCKSKGEEG